MDDVETLDVSNERQVKQRKKAYELRRDVEIEETRKILETYGGRALFWRILERCKLFGAIPTHPQDSFRELGRRDIGLEIFAELLTCGPEYEMIMRNEAVAREAALKGK